MAELSPAAGATRLLSRAAEVGSAGAAVLATGGAGAGGSSGGAAPGVAPAADCAGSPMSADSFARAASSSASLAWPPASVLSF